MGNMPTHGQGVDFLEKKFLQPLGLPNYMCVHISKLCTHPYDIATSDGCH